MNRGPRSKLMGVGSTFGRLTVLELIPDKKNPKARCRCTCGRETLTQRGALVSGKARSCGCLSIEMNQVGNTTHGSSRSPEYLVYMGMLARCNNPKREEYSLYGGRGIRVEYGSFEEFLADVGRRPDGAYIDRMDNDGNYCAGNCHWVTPAASLTNRRISKVWVVDGVEYDSCSAAALAQGVHKSTIARKCNAGTDGWCCRLKYPEGGAQ